MPYFNQQPAGIFGGSPQPGGIWGPVSGFLGNHSNMLMQAGLGMLSGNTPQEGFGNAARGLAYGTQADQTAADRKREEADRKKLADALAKITSSPNGPLQGPYADLAAADPSFAKAALLQKMQPADVPTSIQEYQYSLAHPEARNFLTGGSKREIRNDANGVPRYTDTGDAVYPDDQNASAGTEFFSGRSVQAQGLNYLISQGMSKEDAANVAAGKVVIGPNGEHIFMTPQGLVSTPANGQQQGGQGQDSQQQGNVLTGPKMTEDMRKASGFASRAAAADQIVSDPAIAAAGASLVNKGKASVPFGVGNMLVPETYQKFDQAQRDFVNAILRRESGAAISQSEFENAQKQYFPQPGDGPEVLTQKAANRRLAIESLNTSGQPVPTFGADQNADPLGIR